MNEELLRTIALMQQHQAMLLFTMAGLDEARRQVASGELGNTGSLETEIRLRREAIKQLADSL
jgi:hypothetical protein